MIRYTFAYGYKTRDAAQESLEDSFAHGEVSQAERPVISTYKTFDGRTLWKIELEGSF